MIFKKEIEVLPSNQKNYKLSDEDVGDILKIRQKRDELDPGMGGVDPTKLDAMLKEESKLVSLDIAITSSCNFKCVWCYRPDNEWGKSSINFSLIQDVLNEAADLGVKYLIYNIKKSFFSVSIC